MKSPRTLHVLLVEDELGDARLMRFQKCQQPSYSLSLP